MSPLDLNRELIEAYDAYITLLNEELNSILPQMFVRGWKSTRVQDGIDARKKIEDIKLKLKGE